MAATTIAHKARRISRSRARKVALFGATALTATAMTVGLTTPAMLPDASAADVTLNGVTTGPVFNLLEKVGFDSVDIPNLAPPIIDTLTLNFAYTDSNSVNLADQINAFPFGGFTALANTFRRQPGGTLGSALLAASGFATFGANDAYQALLSSAGGSTLPGYTPLVGPGLTNYLTGAPCSSGFSCTAGNNVTNLALLLLNSPLTPNGGLYTRFAPIANLFGIDPTNPIGASANSSTPATQGNGGKVTLNSAVVNVGLAYNALSDFPATLNPFSLANTLLATILPTNLLGGANLEGTTLTAIETNLGLLAALGTTSTTYGTFAPNDLPLLEPLRLPARLINALSSALGLKLNLGTPLADALQPALSILVNTGYTDVVTPEAGGTYNRTFTTSGDNIPFLSQAPLTPAQWLAVPRNVITALIYGFQKSFPLLSFGQGVPALTATPGDKFLSISYTPAPTGAAARKATQSTAVVTDVTATTPTANTVAVNTTSTGTASSGTTSTPKPSAAKSKPAAANDQSGSDNSGSGNQVKSTSPSRAAASRSAKSAA